MSVTYAFAVVVTAPDGRTDSQTVLASPAYNGSVQVSISTTSVRFNPAAKLIVNGNIRALSTVTSSWTVYSALGTALSYESLTPQSKEFSLSDEVAFPLSMAGGTFVGGNSYSFRLTAYPKGYPDLATYSEIQLQANSPPRGGYLYAEPTSGYALVTSFFISTPGWTADSESLPLRYTFSYRVAASSQYLTLAAASQRDYTRTTLPAGLAVIDHRVTLQSQAIDMLNSSSTTTSTVAVTTRPDTNSSLILSTSLTRAFLTGDINLAYQSMNGAATTVSSVDCSASPNCFALNREYCFLTAGTCGRCFDGFSGMHAISLISLQYCVLCPYSRLVRMSFRY